MHKLAFRLRECDIEHFNKALKFELAQFGLESSLLGIAEDLPLLEPIDPPLVFSNHVAVLGDSKSVDGKKEFSFYYGRNLVTTKLYLVNSGSEDRWKPSDVKWYMVSTL